MMQLYNQNKTFEGSKTVLEEPPDNKKLWKQCVAVSKVLNTIKCTWKHFWGENCV